MKKTDEIISLNRSFEAEFEVMELEQRLETDPLVFIDILMNDIGEAPCEGGYITCDGGYKMCDGGYTTGHCDDVYSVCNRKFDTVINVHKIEMDTISADSIKDTDIAQLERELFNL